MFTGNQQINSMQLMYFDITMYALFQFTVIINYVSKYCAEPIAAQLLVL